MAMNERPRLAFVGADGALGEMLAGPLGARPVSLRCPDLTADRVLPELADADVVIHAAGPRYRPELRWSDYLREHLGTTTVVARSVRPGAYLVYLSSAAVYGARRAFVDATTAEEPSSFPSEPYAWAKLSAEYAVRAICRERGVALTVLRPSIVYGPGSGGVLLTLRALARRGVRAVLVPESLRQHLLHVDLLRRVLQSLAARGARDDLPLLLLADPFVLTTRDLNEAVRRASGGSVAIPVPLRLFSGIVAEHNRRFDVGAAGKLTVLAMLALDNEYDWRPAFDALAIDPAQFGRERFDRFMEG
jgi:nucleoside-diphosphate-sugar epimerase